MNKEQIRKNHNVAVMYKKATKDYNIVRYSNGFNKEPIILLKGIKREELENKVARVLRIIAEASTTFTVFIKPERKYITQIAIGIEDAGVNSSDVHIQSDGKIIFWSEGEDETEVRNKVEDVLMDIGLENVGEMVAVAKKVPLPGVKTEMTDELVKNINKEKAEELPADTKSDGVIRLPQEKIPEPQQPNLQKEQQLYEQLKAKGTLYSATEKALFKKLQAKFEITKEASPKNSVEEEALNIIRESETNPNLSIKTDADLFTELQKRGYSINDLLTYFTNTK